jgi:hypothetical protein
MALSFDSTLTNAKGISKIVLFKGLSHRLVLTPCIIGEPVFTAQPFYFLNEMDSVMISTCGRMNPRQPFAEG